MSATRGVLERLLRRAESAHRRGADEAVAVRMSSVAEYTSLRALADLEAFHADIALAERAGAITVERDMHAGDGGRLLRLRARDTTALARHLGVGLLEDRVAAAEDRLAPWRARFPVLDAVLAAWRANHKVRSAGPEAAGDIADAARAAAARLDDAGEERILRRESVRLCGDSKRLEKLTRWLEILVTGELAASGLADTEVWAMLGLRREPQPFLLAGPGSVRLADMRLPLVRPYLGLPVETVQSIITDARCLVSIENLASFHDAARAPGAAHVLLLYTGGMPSPAWRAAYARILRALPPTAGVYHWGDIDVGGFRIASVLASSASGAGRTLQPWRMSPAALAPDARARGVAPTATVLASMCYWAREAGWSEVADALGVQPLKLEQEALDPDLPVA